MKKYFKNSSISFQQLFIMATIMSMYIIIVSMSKGASPNFKTIHQGKSIGASVQSVLNNVSIDFKGHTKSTNLSSTEENVSTITYEETKPMDIGEYYKELYGPEQDYSKIKINDYEFDYIPGAPYSVYETMAQNLDFEKEKLEQEMAFKQAKSTQVVSEPEYQTPTGSGVLTPSGGVNYFGNQKETYYNLPMSTVVSIAQSNGIAGEYWVRSDGCKMLGDYIMIAANQSVHPYGSLVETSLGTGIVVDTGGFAVNNPYQVDIAVNW